LKADGGQPDEEIIWEREEKERRIKENLSLDPEYFT
jgi:hypothetical protein